MATDEERAHARRLLEIHQSNFRKLEEQAAKYVGGVPLYILNQIDIERANIAALEPIAKPPADATIQAFVSQVSDGNGGNWAMMFAQFVLLNTRMTKMEERMDGIAQAHQTAQIERLDTRETIDHIRAVQQSGEHARQYWGPIYRAAWIVAIVLALAAILITVR